MTTVAEKKNDATAVQAPYRIFVAYYVGSRPHSEVINAPFEDIDNEITYNTVLLALTRAHQPKRVTIMNWRAL
jgi:hypothetical protein